MSSCASVRPPPQASGLHEVDIVAVPWVSRQALLQGTGVKHRLSLGLAAENNHEVGCCDGLAIIIELNNAILGELGEETVSAMETAPSTIFLRAAMIASACWRRALPARFRKRRTGA